MKLSAEDKRILSESGYKDEDMAQIERATKETVYTLITRGDSPVGITGKHLRRICFRCGSPVKEEKELPQYPYYCPECDENLYEFETRFSREIKAEQAARILGREAFLLGIARSAFHWSALVNYHWCVSVDQVEEGTVEFDSSKMFMKRPE